MLLPFGKDRRGNLVLFKDGYSVWLDPPGARKELESEPAQEKGTQESIFRCAEEPGRQLVLNKGTQRFTFLYQTGREGDLLDALVNLAKDKHTDFGWFDAAGLSFKLTQSLIGKGEPLLA